MALVGKTNEEKIWNYLQKHGMNFCGVAGLMGNLFAESGLNPQNLQNSCEKKLGYTDASYTAAVDNGSYTNFAKDSAGYGLAQWTYWLRKQQLQAYAKQTGKSIGDLEMQLEYLIHELRTGYKAVFETLKTAKSVREASDAVLIGFEKPANQSDSVKKKRSDFGQKFYDKYAEDQKKTENGGKKVMTEQEIRKKLVDIAVGYLGCKESDGSHKKIIDLYNSHKPLARSYKVKYTDEWCSTFASAVAIQAGLTDIIPTECGCEKHIELFKKKRCWVEDDAYVPKIGDYIFYDWDDNGIGDCTGHADHVGIVAEVKGRVLRIIEGNMNEAVGFRTISVNGRFIRGYGVPKYSSKGGSSETAQDNTYTVKSGDSLWKISQTFLGNGARYKEIMDLNGMVSQTIKPGQVLKLPM